MVVRTCPSKMAFSVGSLNESFELTKATSGILHSKLKRLKQQPVIAINGKAEIIHLQPIS